MAPHPQTDNSPFPLTPTEDDVAGHGTPDDGSLAGASGTSSGGITISRGALVAIIVVVVVVALAGIASSVLFYVAKKREWTVKETIRRSARKVVTALTPRRSEFPRSVKEGGGSRNGRVKLDDVPPTPRLTPERLEDLEKGLEGKKKNKKSNFSRK
ncbi:hypothetical protein QC763_406690 [Podospora pseudopauciseta]|uniref:Transmembrane protein n=2 Tax=Podospora TaxID=5144 RepID=A0ABR0HDI0_9PEZI|nr:hypothetical protein QC763_406690 [Podospora pseudopauciseta]KAK4677290.1 hypothetical protein QC764_406690 [Podospora pseudoanserina]